jgi:hypothetical protein
MSLELKGPQRIIRKTGEIKDLKQTDIENATIQIKNRTYHLLQNHTKFSYDKKDNEIYVYHMYDYLDNGKGQFGRWYNWFKKLPIKENQFVYKIKEYQDEDGTNIGPATITINFTDKASQKIQKLNEKLN